MVDFVPLHKGNSITVGTRSMRTARVLIGLTAATKHVQYRVSLPDHEWVVAAKHVLVPSVYDGIEIQKDGLGKSESVTYSDSTYIDTRSGIHCLTSGYVHRLDYKRLLELEVFNFITKNQNKLVKFILIFSVDGGPDENPRYQNVIDVVTYNFQG